jgi:hypothetical protein
MIDRSLRTLTLGLLATTAMASPAFAQNVPADTATQPQTTGQSPAPGTNATDVTSPPPKVQQAQAAKGLVDQNEIIITATKREENLQNVPISVQPKDPEEAKALQRAQLLTAKPVLYVCNVDEARRLRGSKEVQRLPENRCFDLRFLVALLRLLDEVRHSAFQRFEVGDHQFGLEANI